MEQSPDVLKPGLAGSSQKYLENHANIFYIAVSYSALPQIFFLQINICFPFLQDNPVLCNIRMLTSITSFLLLFYFSWFFLLFFF